jgi:arabinan endo-1,5-alpha-L-arabinosidase
MAEEETKYTNPVYAPVFADPCVIRHEGVYYAYATEDYGEWKKDDDPLNNVSNTQCVPILSSLDLVTWRFEGAAFKGLTRPSWGAPGGFVWAPDVVKLGEKFVMYYSISVWGDENPGIGVAVADHPAGPWTDRGKLFTSQEIGVDNSIDPAVFLGQDGRLYMIWGSFRGLFGVELTADGTGLKNGLEYAGDNKTLVAGIIGGWNGNTYEAPYVLYKDGYYYLFVSSGTCCNGFNSTYHVRVGRSKDPLGPYADHDGNDMRAANRGFLVVDKSDDFVGVGHNAVIGDDGGGYFMLYHGLDKSKPIPGYGQNQNARALLIDKLEFNAAGWPEVKGKVAGKAGMIRPVINK